MAGNHSTALNPGSGGDGIYDEDIGGSVYMPASKIHTGALGVDGGPVTNANPLPTSGGQTTSATTVTQVPSSATSVTILAANANRVGAAIYNDSSQILYLKLNSGAASSSSYTVQLGVQGYYCLPFRYVGVITGIWAAANGNAYVTEFTP